MKLLALMAFAVFAHLALAATEPQGSCEKIRSATNRSGKAINLVFVASGFNGQMAHFEESIRTFWAGMEDYAPFSRDVDSLNVFISKHENKANSFCDYDGRKLHCNYLKGKSLGNKCDTTGKTKFIVIHNSTEYGGLGGEIPSASVNRDAVHLIVHELGHSLWDLADEYTDRDGVSHGKNCSSSSACAEWQDLIDAGLASCQEGCNSNRFYSDETNVMRNFNQHSYGHVNRRLICCQFKRFTDEYPRFCDEYKDIGEGLDKFCR